MEQQQFICLFDQNCLGASSVLYPWDFLEKEAYGQECRQNVVCEPTMSMNFCFNVHTFQLASRTMKHMQEPFMCSCLVS